MQWIHSFPLSILRITHRKCVFIFLLSTFHYCVLISTDGFRFDLKKKKTQN